MKNKRGLSQVVTTLLLVLLIMVALGGIWLVVSSFIDSGSQKINLDKFTLSLSLKKAVVNYSTGIADVRVRRDSGEGDLKAIKFIVEDDKNSEVFEETFDNFPELAERTFTLDLNSAEFLTLNKVHKISIAPVFSMPSGNLETGEIAGSIEGLNKGIEAGNSSEEGGTPENSAECSVDDDCLPDFFVEGTKACNDARTMVTQTQVDNFCQFNTYCASVRNYDVVVEDCTAIGLCSLGECVTEEKTCTPETVEADCGTNGPTGEPVCHATLNATVQKYYNFTCNAGTCEYEIIDGDPVMCEEGQFCKDGVCFTPLECDSNPDCCEDPDVPYCGRICNNGVCEDELVRNTGIVGTPWPPGINEYFDSVDLNTVDENDDILGQTIIFPGSAETRCLNVRNFVHMNFNGVISYVQLNETTTAIAAGDNYEVWETPFGCTRI